MIAHLEQYFIVGYLPGFAGASI